MRSRSALCAVAWSAVMVLAGSPLASRAAAAVIAPEVRALELPAGVTSVAADDPLLAPILNAASSTSTGRISHDAQGKRFSVGKTPVTWKDSADGKTLSRNIYLYPHGWQVLGRSGNLRTFEHNGATHMLHDGAGRVHVVYTDGAAIWYRAGKPQADRVEWLAATNLSEGSVPAGATSLVVRGQTLALVSQTDGKVTLQAVWTSTWPAPRSVYARRITLDAKGAVTLGPVVNTAINGVAAATTGPARKHSWLRMLHAPLHSLLSLAADSKGHLHLVAESHGALVYAHSQDGVQWVSQQVWHASQTGSREYRYPSLAVDSHDRVHIVWQTMGYQGKPMWWVGLYTLRDPRTNKWSPLENVLAKEREWQAPARQGQDVLFAYPALRIDGKDNVHIAWHGTCKSHKFGEDDTFYIMRPYNAQRQDWDSWTGYAVLHQRDHFRDSQGEDSHYSWVPSLACKPGDDEVYAMIMFGPADDERDDSLNTTEGALKIRRNGKWLRSFENLTQTPGLRSWYPSIAPTTWEEEHGRTWLDMIWLDGTADDYNVLFRRVRLPASQSAQ